MKKHEGFTIVEILIVIVVIAILAAITVVAYNGITTRAENTKTINSVSEYVKVITAYGAENGSYPKVTSCLGPEGTVCSNTTGDTAVCFTTNGGGKRLYQPTFGAAIQTVAVSMPAPSTQTMNCGGDMYGGAYYAYGGDHSYMYYYLKGNQDCSLVGGVSVSKNHKDNVTHCFVTLSDL